MKSLKIIKVKDYNGDWYSDYYIIREEDFERAKCLLDKVYKQWYESCVNGENDISLFEYINEALNDNNIDFKYLNNKYYCADIEYEG